MENKDTGKGTKMRPPFRRYNKYFELFRRV